MVKWELYENDGGFLYLCILDDNGKCLGVFNDWEYGPKGNLAGALKQLDADFNDWKYWDNDYIRFLADEGTEITAEAVYASIDDMGDLVADYTGYISNHIGVAGKKAMDVD